MRDSVIVKANNNGRVVILWPFEPIVAARNLLFSPQLHLVICIIIIIRFRVLILQALTRQMLHRQFTRYRKLKMCQCLLRIWWMMNDKYVCLWGRPYIHTYRSYVHMPHDFTNGTSKFYVASFILVGEIRNRTNTHTQTNSTWYIHTLPIGMCG